MRKTFGITVPFFGLREIGIAIYIPVTSKSGRCMIKRLKQDPGEGRCSFS